MTEEVLNKIEELLNEFDKYETIFLEWAWNHKMGLYVLLQEFGYGYERDKNGRLKVVHDN